MGDPELERSRALMRRTLLEMESLRRSAGPVELRRKFSGPRAWRLLRRTLERFQQLLGRVREGVWPDAALTKPEWERRRRELEARGLRVESAQRELETRRRGFDADWERVFAELESVQEGWLLLQKELPPGDAAAVPAALQERLARMEVLFSELLEEEGQLQRERAMVDRLWRWLVGVWLPSAEEALPEDAAQELWSSLRRRIRDLDRRWRGSLSDLKRVLTEEEVSHYRERLEEAERRAEALSRDFLALQEGRRIESLPSSLEPQFAALQKSLEESRESLRSERARQEELSKSLEALREKSESQEKALSLAREKHRQAQLRFSSLEQELEQERAKRGATQDDIAAGRGRAEALERSLQETREKLRILQAGTGREEELLRDNAALRAQMETLQEEAAAHAERARQMRQQAQAALRERRRALREREAFRQSAELAREKDVERMEKSRAAWSSCEKDLRGKLQTLQETFDAAQRERAALRRNMEILSAERDEWRRRLSAAVKTFGAGKIEPPPEEPVRPAPEPAKEPSKELIAEIEVLRLAKRNLQHRVAQLENACAAAQDEARSIAAARDDARAALDDARAAVAAAPPQAEGGLPSVEPVLDPAWARVALRLKNSMALAFAHLRRLASGRLAEGQKALLKLAAGEIAKSQDTLHVLSEYLEEPPEGIAARVETILDAALSAWEPALRRRKIALARRMETLPAAKFHAQALRMAFYQLVRNAYEAMPRGGVLTVRAQADESGRPCVLFCDTGPGFSQDALARVFEPFFSTKPGHLGLGLAFARRTAARFGGDVCVCNAQEKGMGAIVRLSVGAGPAPEETPSFEPSGPSINV